MINKNSKILLTGHNGLVGSSLLRILKKKKFKKIFTFKKKDLDLRDQDKVKNIFNKYNFDVVINAAAKVGGIFANDNFKADFLYDNLQIQNNIVHFSHLFGVKNLLLLGSSCIYPKFCRQPIKEKYLLTGPIESTNEPYAIAKIAGLKMCEAYNFQYKTNYKYLMPCNLFGPNDNYNLDSSHFFPALIKKIDDAKKNNSKSIIIWGSGKPKRELMYVDDFSESCLFFLQKQTKETYINIGSGIEMTIHDYAKFIMSELNINLKIKYDKIKPNGVHRKLLDSSIAKKYGWKPKYSLKKAFRITYVDYLKKKKILYK